MYSSVSMTTYTQWFTRTHSTQHIVALTAMIYYRSARENKENREASTKFSLLRAVGTKNVRFQQWITVMHMPCFYPGKPVEDSKYRILTGHVDAPCAWVISHNYLTSRLQAFIQTVCIYTDSVCKLVQQGSVPQACKTTLLCGYHLKSKILIY